jgi:extracellular matrix regulatory protein A
MDTRLINIGFGNIVAASRIIAIVSPDSAPIKRIIQEARDKGILIDATYGRRTRAVVITDSGHVVLSAVQPETVAHRFTSKEAVEDQEEDLEEEEPEAGSAADQRMSAGGDLRPRDRAAQAGE